MYVMKLELDSSFLIKDNLFKIELQTYTIGIVEKFSLS